MNLAKPCGRCGGSGRDREQAEVEVRVLGSFGMVVDNRQVDEWRRRQAELVMLLALSPDRRRSRGAVITALWPHLPEDRGVANLHKVAHQVRCHTGRDDTIVLDNGHVWLWPDTSVSIDLEDLERRSIQALTNHDADRCSTLAERCRTGLAPLVHDEPWAQPTRRQLDRLHHQLLDAAGRFHDLLALDPTNEAAHRGLMRSALERRDPGAALTRYRRLCHQLADLDLRPAPETVALYHQAAADAHHRAAPARPPLVGHDDELRSARQRLRQATAGEGGTVLLHGPGGATATRVALEITDEATDAGCTVLRTAAVASQTPVPYGPVTTAVERLMATRPELAIPLPAKTRQQLDRLLEGAHGSRPDPAEATPAMAVRDLLEHAAGLGTSVLLVDDLQDADVATARLLGELADAIRFAPVVVVLTLSTDGDLPDHVAALVRRLVNGRTCTDLAIRPVTPVVA